MFSKVSIEQANKRKSLKNEKMLTFFSNRENGGAY
jgi:hypothetical protein